MKPYLITKSNSVNENKLFLDSFRKLQNSVEHISYQLLPYWTENPEGTTVIKINHHFRYHADKFLELNILELDLNRWIIFTDTTDILFQKPIPEFDDNKEIYVSS